MTESRIGLKSVPTYKPDPTYENIWEFAVQQLAVTGCGHVVGRECDPVPYLKSRKSRKFMGLQDELAVVAAARAMSAAGLCQGPREGAHYVQSVGERCGLYLSVGLIPFGRTDLDALVDSSTTDGAFSMERFSTSAFRTLNPLLTFRCLPNMPAFHVSLNLDIQGPYWVGYPGIGQFYVALEEACAALADGTIDVALVGGVADQDNFLVQHHFSRIDQPIDPAALRSAAGFIVLERRDEARKRGAGVKAQLKRAELLYRPVDPFDHAATHEEQLTNASGLALGPASLAVGLSTASAGTLSHSVASRDCFVASSEWEIA